MSNETAWLMEHLEAHKQALVKLQIEKEKLIAKHKEEIEKMLAELDEEINLTDAYKRYTESLEKELYDIKKDNGLLDETENS